MKNDYPVWSRTILLLKDQSNWNSLISTALVCSLINSLKKVKKTKINTKEKYNTIKWAIFSMNPDKLENLLEQK